MGLSLARRDIGEMMVELVPIDQWTVIIFPLSRLSAVACITVYRQVNFKLQVDLQP